MFFLSKKIIFVSVLVGVFLVAGLASAQDLGLNEFARGTNLGAKPLGQIVAEIVRVFLSVLGVLAVILILYGGFIWMTAAGDPTKIGLARKILVNGLIGLVIILSSLAITQFIIGAIQRATGTRITGELGPPGGAAGGLSPESFVIKGISPQGAVPIRNVVVRVSFNHPVDEATINGNILIIKKTDNSLAPYNYAASGDKLELTSAVSCEAPNQSVKCFEANTTYKLELKSGLKNTAGRNLLCGGLAPTCAAEFTAGSLIDTQAPQAAITYPDPGQSIAQNSEIQVWARATDDAGISHLEFFRDGAYFGNSFPSGSTPKEFNGNVFWGTQGVSLGKHILAAKAYDVDANNAFSPNLEVMVRPAHCFNNLKDADETDVDCGGADCALCSGGSCTDNAQCVSGSCVSGLCVNTPLILNVSPDSGAPGSYVTIFGKYFGAGGTVTFLGGAESGDDRIASLAPCANSWQNERIIVVVPPGAASGPLQVQTAQGLDTANDARGPLLPDFLVNNLSRPGICALNPAEGKKGVNFKIEGTGFGKTQETSFIIFGKTYALPQSWSDVAIGALVPPVLPGDNLVSVNRGGVESNALTFRVLEPTAGTRPIISYVNPESGPPGEYLTLFGSNFGQTAGVVEFLRQDGTRAIGDTNFPVVCQTAVSWRDNYIIIKVPEKFTDGGLTKNTTASLQIRRADGAVSNALSFSITSTAPRPGICALNPDNGPLGVKVDILGERFGVSGVITFYNNVKADALAWGGELVKTSLPQGAVSGPVKLTVENRDSNSVNFSVGDCRINPNLCGATEQCCNSSCILKTAKCEALAKEGAYGWRISTGFIPTIPRVLEECSSEEKAKNPTPAPWNSRPGGNSVCINAIVGFRFNTLLDLATVRFGTTADTIALYECQASGANLCASKKKVSLDLVNSRVYLVDDYSHGVELYPQGKFLPNTYYRVELRTDIRASGAGGGFMEERADCGQDLSYCFEFKTKNSASLCQVGSVVVSPIDKTAKEQEDIDYLASLRAKEDVCLNINAASYAYDWDSSDTTKAYVAQTGKTIAGTSTPQAAVVRAISETQTAKPVIISGKVLDFNVSGSGTLTIDFVDPAVISQWPLCAAACVNSTIGAVFNTKMDEITLNQTTVAVWKCKNESCLEFEGAIAGGIQYNKLTKTLTFLPDSALEISRYYLVRLDTLGIRSASGVNLVGANDGRYFAWKFKTRSDTTPCAIAKVKLEPESKILNYIWEIARLDAEALGAPDNCSALGQKLNPYGFAWQWQTGAATIASLVDDGGLNVLPPIGGVCTDQCLRPGSEPKASVCGNTKQEKGEDCDDGNVKSGDGCSLTCLNEGAKPTCGNKLKETGEDCDDGNTLSRDGCSDTCLNEGSFLGRSTCGNGDLGNGEDCDDGNSSSGDGCSSLCLNEGSRAGIASCGNGLPEYSLGEDCDDGNTKSGDGCSSICLNEGSIAAQTTCGNTTIDFGEDCDDGNTKSGDGCSGICLHEGSSLNYSSPSLCGNNAVEVGEDCDLGSRDKLIDPRQYVRAENKGKARIFAATQNVGGQSEIEVSCVYTNDSQCVQFGDNLGVGVDGCCHPKPQIKNVIPKINETGVCRNTLISATFNQLMDENSGIIFIDEKKGGADCPAGSKLLLGNWCEAVIKVSRTVADDKDEKQTTFNFNINNLLKANTEYRVRLQDFKSIKGAGMGQEFNWTFSAGSNVCALDFIKISPNPLIFNEVGTKDAKADAMSLAALAPLSSVPGIYEWKWSWTASPDKFITLANTSIQVTAVTAKPQNGEETLVAQATITADTLKLSREKNVFGQGKVIVFLCQKPWPSREAGFPFIEASQNFNVYYCRDGNPELPYLETVGIIPQSPEILKETLLRDPQSGSAIGLRVYKNLDHLGPLTWYRARGFAGAPQPTKADNYDAILDGRSTYINFANNIGQTNFTNILLLSYDTAAAGPIGNIYGQLLKNLRFNVNLENIEKCAKSGGACQSNLDCDLKTGDYCQAEKYKLQRDTRRLADFNEMAALLEKYKKTNNNYPELLAGTYLRGLSVSVWPSWQAAFGNALGAGLASDPLNKHASCEGSYDATTCWSGAEGKYLCPAGSRVYRYTNAAQEGYKLSSDFEFMSGAGWVNAPPASFELSGICTNQVIGASAKCGDGVLGEGEECEGSSVKYETCTSGGRSGIRKLTCGAAVCLWDRTAPCQVGQCGDGLMQAPEFCDDGQSNGKYGFCNTSCTGKAAYCGDGVKESANEMCDLGSQNGVYGSGCSWDCKVPGPSCGDKLIQSNEECDGNTEMTTAGCEGIKVNGYGTQKSRSCQSTCAWGAWSACLPQGVCGNGLKEGAELCDDGNLSNTDGCTSACKLAICGDGFLQTGKELCDNGINNGKECSPGYGLTCNYCSTTCTVLTKTGLYCGDGIKNGPEACDGSVTDLTCKNFGFANRTDTALRCSSACQIDTASCTKVWYRINAGGPQYLDWQGNLWQADAYYNTGQTFEKKLAIAKTELDPLYQTERWDRAEAPELKYSLPISTGRFRVKLHFAEIFQPGSNLRIFDVKIEGKAELQNFDIYAEAGGSAIALIKEFTLDVLDGSLDIEFIRKKENPKISAIEVELLQYLEVAPTGGGTWGSQICGNGITEGTEVCDAGVNNGKAGYCSGECNSYLAPEQMSLIIPTQVCGNGKQEGTEVCDSGALNGTEGSCNSTCTGWVPVASYCDPNVCQGNIDACAYQYCSTAGAGGKCVFSFSPNGTDCRAAGNVEGKCKTGDCIPLSQFYICGNGVCESVGGENSSNCPADCR